jgi:hypothetical protein
LFDADHLTNAVRRVDDVLTDLEGHVFDLFL